MLYKFFDTHAHYNIEPLVNDADNALLELVHEKTLVNIIGTNLQDNLIAIELAKKHQNAIVSIGIHPSETLDLELDDLNVLESLYLKNKKYVYAIGECGLDYFYLENLDKEKQKSFFKKQLELALKYNLPLVMHVRDAHNDAIAILKSYDLKNINVIIHCYTDKLEYAQEYISIGCYISFSGIVTFKNAHIIQNVVSHLPIEHLLSETDAPFLSPDPFRGKINNSKNIKYINEFIAKLRNMESNQMNDQLLKNAFNAFKIKNYI